MGRSVAGVYRNGLVYWEGLGENALLGTVLVLVPRGSYWV